MRSRPVSFGLAGSFVLLAACSAPQLTPMGRGVVAMGAPPMGRCQPLGPVTGESRGAYSAGSLIEYATNDVRNQAAAVGATHIHTAQPSLVYSANQQSAGVSGATVSGTAYRCAGEAALEVRPQRGIYAALRPAPAWPTPPADATPLMVAEVEPPPVEAAVRGAIDARRREILTCAGRPMVAVDAGYTAAGAVRHLVR